MVTTFEATDNSQAKFKRNYHGTEKIANVTMQTERLATMLICKHCGKDWNHHSASPTERIPAGMCFTDENFKATKTYLIDK